MPLQFAQKWITCKYTGKYIFSFCSFTLSVHFCIIHQSIKQKTTFQTRYKLSNSGKLIPSESPIMLIVILDEMSVSLASSTQFLFNQCRCLVTSPSVPYHCDVNAQTCTSQPQWRVIIISNFWGIQELLQAYYERCTGSVFLVVNLVHHISVHNWYWMTPKSVWIRCSWMHSETITKETLL